MEYSAFNDNCDEIAYVLDKNSFAVNQQRAGEKEEPNIILGEIEAVPHKGQHNELRCFMDWWKYKVIK